MIFFWSLSIKNIIFWSTLPYFIIHSFIAHKELRFIFPVLAFSPYYIAFFIDHLKPYFLQNIYLIKLFKTLMCINFIGLLFYSIYSFKPELKVLKNIYYSDKSVLECYDWVCVVDDDTFVNTKKLDEYIEEITDDSVYGDLITPENSPDNPIWKDLVLEHDYVYHSGGGGVLIPSKLLLDIEFEECGTVWDDVTVGVIFGRNNIPLVDSEVFKSQPPEFYGNTDDDVKNVVTYHHIKPDRMRLFYEKLG